MQYGCIPSLYDSRDYKLKASAVELPDSFELDFTEAAVKNQGSVSSCVAHAASTILEYHAGCANKLSTNFIYGLPKKLFDHSGPGMYLRDACKIMNQYGDALVLDCPGNTEVTKVHELAEAAVNNENCIKRAANYKIQSYYRCYSQNDVKLALINHGPVLISVKWYDDYRVKDGVLCGGNVKDYGYHAIVVYGYNETGFLCQNSWGSKWGNEGRFILPYSISFAEAWGLVDAESEDNDFIKIPSELLQIFYGVINFLGNLILRFKKLIFK